MRDNMIKVGKISDIPEGEGRVFRLNGSEIAIFRLATEIEGSSGQAVKRSSGKTLEPSNPRTLEPFPVIVAIENKCPHQNGPLADGIVAGDHVICPLHGHKFNLKTGESLGDDKEVKTYPVFIDGDEIIIEKEGT